MVQEDLLLEKLAVEKHKKFIHNSQKLKDGFEYVATEHLRISGGYWGLMGMYILDSLGEMNKDEIVAYVLSCQQQPCGGFGGHVGHDPHMLYTLSAVQILALFDELDQIDRAQRSDGSFQGDQYGEVDTRFSYCALNCLAHLGHLDMIDMDKAVDFILSAMNFDGGFGCVPGAETHGGQIFCCVGALAIAGRLEDIDHDLLGWWLAERQLPGGGLNGRPEKLPDVCYSWWNLSALLVLDRLKWINKDKLIAFILECQDLEDGGIADRPGDMPDIFHTYFGLAAFSLMGCKGVREIDPVYAMPIGVTQRLDLPNTLAKLRACGPAQ